jgi:ACS family hexuronate transporter-like MFS transporter
MHVTDPTSDGARQQWRLAILVSVAIAISYLDRQTLPIAIGAIGEEIPISNTVKAFLDSAFLITYGIMYVGGGRLVDLLGTRRGFAIIMVFWSLACASHGFAGGVIALAASRLLLGMGEGGGFPAATRVVAERFSVNYRSTAMGIINAGTGIGGILAPPLIALVILNVHWLDLSSWRWVFFITGAFGLVWTVWWLKAYRFTDELPAKTAAREAPTPIRELFRHRETWGIVGAKFLSDAAWYFYMFWLPKYLLDARGFNIKSVGEVAWIPFAAAAAGCLVGGALSSALLQRGYSVNAARKWALGLSAALMPCVMLVPQVSVPWVIVLFSIAFFGQQSWSTLVMTLPTDLFPKKALGTVAGFVGMGGAFGGVAIGQLAGWALDHGFTYTPILVLAGSLHVIAFLVILITVRTLRPLPIGSVLTT